MQSSTNRQAHFPAAQIYVASADVQMKRGDFFQRLHNVTVHGRFMLGSGFASAIVANYNCDCCNDYSLETFLDNFGYEFFINEFNALKVDASRSGARALRLG